MDTPANSEQALRQLNDLMDAMPDALIQINAEGFITSWNLAARRILGWSADEALGHSLRGMINAGSGSHDFMLPGTRTLEAIGKLGVAMTLELSVFALDGNGSTGYGVLIRDITRHHAQQEALRRSQEHHLAVIEHVNEGMIVVKEGRVAYANALATEIADISLDEMMQVGYLHRVHPDDRDLVQDRQRRRLAGEPVPSRYELRLLLPDGTVRWIGISVAVVPWDGESATLTFFSDISQRKVLETTLRDTLEERETVLKNSLVGISFNVNRRLQWVNDKYQEMTGYSREELVGQSTRLLYVDDESHEAEAEKTRTTLETKGVYFGERQLLRRNGEAMWVQLAGRCVKDRDPQAGVIWTLLDITERHRAEANIRAALEREKELNDLRSRFVSMTSHEFRTPLAAILSAAELLRDYGGRMPANERAEIFENIGAGVKRMAGMLDRALFIGQGEVGMLEFRPQPVDLGALCQAIVEESRLIPAAAKCTWQTRFEVPTGPVVLDAKLLRHILENLLSNAIKYSPVGGQIEFTVLPLGTRWVFAVQDHGIGIPKDEIPHLFDSFHRASNVGDIQGTGLGLAIAKKAAELHGGIIEVNSQSGGPTRFTVTL